VEGQTEAISLAEAIAALRGAVEGHDELFTTLSVAAEQTAREQAIEHSVEEEVRAALAAAEQQSVTAALDEAVAAYRRAVLAADPGLPPELVSGSSIAAIDTAVEAARATVAKVRERVLAEAAKAVPAGAPGRTPPDLDSLTPREKIVLGIKG
jgi:hypothetical protein